MDAVLEFFSLKDAVPLLLLFGLLEFVGGQIAGNSSTFSWWARGFAAAGFLSYTVAGIATWEPATAWEFLTLGLRALLAMGIVHGLAGVVLPILGFLYRHVWAAPLERQRAWAEEQSRRAAHEQEEREAAEREQEERARQAEVERRRQQDLANQPPPPTREELMAAAKQAFENTLRVLDTAGLDALELQGARAQARRDYLRRIDEIMK